MLMDWLKTQPRPRGRVLAGEAGVILARDPDTSVGIDVTYINAEVMASQSDATTMVEGIPTLAVEILRWRKKKEEEDHAQAVADTPKTKDELAERLRKGNV